MDFYTLIGPDGQTNWVDAESMEQAYEMALEQFGQGATLRKTWYGEWDCGTEESVAQRGYGCYYDKYGTHHKIEKGN